MSVVAIFLVVVGELMSIAVILAAVAAVANIARLLHDLARVYGNGTRQLGCCIVQLGPSGQKPARYRGQSVYTMCLESHVLLRQTPRANE